MKPLNHAPYVHVDSAAHFFGQQRSHTVVDANVSGQAIREAAWNSAGTKLVCATAHKGLRVWITDKMDSSTSHYVQDAHSKSVEAVSWDPAHNDILATCSADLVRIWDVREKTCLVTFQTHAPCILVRFSPNGQYLVVVTNDEIVTVLYKDNLKSLHPVGKYDAHELVCDVAWSNDSTILAVSQANGNVRLVRVSSDSVALVHTLRAHKTAATCVCFDPRGNLLAVGSNEGIVSLWDVQEWICTRTFHKNDHTISSISFSFDGVYLLIARENSEKVEIVHATASDARVLASVTRPMAMSKPHVSWNPLNYSWALVGDTKGLVLFGR